MTLYLEKKNIDKNRLVWSELKYAIVIYNIVIYYILQNIFSALLNPNKQQWKGKIPEANRVHQATNHIHIFLQRKVCSQFTTTLTCICTQYLEKSDSYSECPDAAESLLRRTGRESYHIVRHNVIIASRRQYKNAYWFAKYEEYMRKHEIMHSKCY